MFKKIFVTMFRAKQQLFLHDDAAEKKAKRNHKLTDR